VQCHDFGDGLGIVPSRKVPAGRATRANDFVADNLRTDLKSPESVVVDLIAKFCGETKEQ
jgi:hypothetical protein